MTSTLRTTILASLRAVMLLAPLSAEAQPRPCAPHDRNCSAPAQHGPQHGVKPGAQHGAKPGPAHGANTQRPPIAQHAQPQRHPAPPAAHNVPGRPHPQFSVHPGHSAAKGRPFQRGKHSRFNAPPRGQEYRVINDHLVLADSRTLKVVAVLGLMNELMR